MIRLIPFMSKKTISKVNMGRIKAMKDTIPETTPIATKNTRVGVPRTPSPFCFNKHARDSSLDPNCARKISGIQSDYASHNVAALIFLEELPLHFLQQELNVVGMEGSNSR